MNESSSPPFANERVAVHRTTVRDGVFSRMFSELGFFNFGGDRPCRRNICGLAAGPRV
jgi:hypothetical protein